MCDCRVCPIKGTTKKQNRIYEACMCKSCFYTHTCEDAYKRCVDKVKEANHGN